MQTFMSDLKYGLRMLRKTAVLTAVALLSLALGVGANAALGPALALVGVGGILGGMAALALRKVVSAHPDGVEAGDPVTLAATSTMLLGAALLACGPPAWRASRVDPLKALRCD